MLSGKFHCFCAGSFRGRRAQRGFVGDVKVAERNGRQLGLANLEVLAGMYA